MEIVPSVHTLKQNANLAPLLWFNETREYREAEVAQVFLLGLEGPNRLRNDGTMFVE